MSPSNPTRHNFCLSSAKFFLCFATKLGIRCSAYLECRCLKDPRLRAQLGSDWDLRAGHDVGQEVLSHQKGKLGCKPKRFLPKRTFRGSSHYSSCRAAMWCPMAESRDPRSGRDRISTSLGIPPAPAFLSGAAQPPLVPLQPALY